MYIGHSRVFTYVYPLQQYVKYITVWTCICFFFFFFVLVNKKTVLLRRVRWKVIKMTSAPPSVCRGKDEGAYFSVHFSWKSNHSVAIYFPWILYDFVLLSTYYCVNKMLDCRRVNIVPGVDQPQNMIDFHLFWKIIIPATSIKEGCSNM